VLRRAFVGSGTTIRFHTARRQTTCLKVRLTRAPADPGSPLWASEARGFVHHYEPRLGALDSALGVPWLRRPTLLCRRPEDRQAYSDGFRSGIAAPQASSSSRKADCQFLVTTS
jgi:hypothetical protein